MRNKLAIFDMDKTIAKTFLQFCLFEPAIETIGQQILHKKNMYWHQKISQVIKSTNYDHKKLYTTLNKIQMVDGMIDVFKYLDGMNFRLVIMSGGNKFLIDEYLKLKKCRKYFSHIFAHDMHYNQSIGKFSYLNLLPSKCYIDTCDLGYCKNVNFNKQIPSSTQYKEIYFFGDGVNDLCGMSQISKGQVFIRRHQQLYKLLNPDQRIQKDNNGNTNTNDFAYDNRKYNQMNHQKLKKLIQVKINYWENGYDILEILQNLNSANPGE